MIRRTNNSIFFNAYLWFTHRIVWALISWWLNKRWTALNMSVNLRDVYEHIANAYETEWQDNGLMGVIRLRRDIKHQIDDLSIATFLSKQASVKGSVKSYASLNFEEAYSHLAVYKDVFTKIVWTVQTLAVLKRTLTLILNILTIPVIVFQLWVLIRKIAVGFALTSTTTLGIYYVDAYSSWKWPGQPDIKQDGFITTHLKSVIRKIREVLDEVFNWASDTVKGKEIIKPEAEVKKIDIFTPKQQNTGWIPSWAYDDKGEIHKYIVYTGIAVTAVVGTIILYSLFLGSTPPTPPSNNIPSNTSARDAAATTGGVLATMWAMIPDGLRNPFRIFNWWNDAHPNPESLRRNRYSGEVFTDNTPRTRGRKKWWHLFSSSETAYTPQTQDSETVSLNSPLFKIRNLPGPSTPLPEHYPQDSTGQSNDATKKVYDPYADNSYDSPTPRPRKGSPSTPMTEQDLAEINRSTTSWADSPSKRNTTPQWPDQETAYEQNNTVQETPQTLDITDSDNVEQQEPSTPTQETSRHTNTVEEASNPSTPTNSPRLDNPQPSTPVSKKSGNPSTYQWSGLAFSAEMENKISKASTTGHDLIQTAKKFQALHDSLGIDPLNSTEEDIPANQRTGFINLQEQFKYNLHRAVTEGILKECLHPADVPDIYTLDSTLVPMCKLCSEAGNSYTPTRDWKTYVTMQKAAKSLGYNPTSVFPLDKK